MEPTVNNSPLQMVEQREPIKNKGTFIEANTKRVTLEHLKKDCIIPVFAKDNETTISHYGFFMAVREAVNQLLPNNAISGTDIRVSHVIKGRTPSAIGKPAKELLEHEKTIYYERCAFVMEIEGITAKVGNNQLNLTIGGVRAYNQENLYSKKSLEKFKLFVGFSNRVCTNLCVSTDGLLGDVRVADVNALNGKMANLLSEYDRDSHILDMEAMTRASLDESTFAHVIGKMKMYHQLDRASKGNITPVMLNDGQIGSLVKGYYHDRNFKALDGKIDLWRFYNLLTGANKSSYIDSYLERGVNAHAMAKELANSMKNGTPNWLLPQYNIAFT